MTPEQMRIAIAEECGWRRCNCREQPCEYWLPPDINDPEGKNWCLAHSELPDYLNDLNAMHEAEKTFDDKTVDKQSLYYDHLSLVVGWKSKTPAEARWESTWGCFRATALQRAEAFLHTVRKWRE